MKRLIHDWWLGFQLLVRLAIALLCMAVGGGMLVGLQIVLHALHVSIPQYLFVALQILYVPLVCPLVLASYARYCGFMPRASDPPAHN